ncbi:hypothetical protein HanHA300_Chr00c0654g0796291 [Helianthus annuus]|nr:hypothetical protein HanHA89_Chr14g0557491 [Helianthus annuus]KAJ0629123.1 hypothetical protein HanHA300_Chr00c0654g0796291 [Helianthus annuus]KAJ0807219.1 hypothetical protein HanOQP8_Chr00c073g0742461 [Helianthus annuus]KAJ0817902.1 hypothetical protein HanLR1_Chr00c0391g0747391 [Helianthus annuus]
MPPSPAAMDVEEDASNTGPKNTTSNSVEEGKLSPETCSTPSKSPCSTNSMFAKIPTPIKNLNFDAEGNTEEEGWVTEAKRNNLEISQSVIICISDLAFKYAGIVPDLFVLKRSVCIFKRSYTFLISCVLKEGDEGA